MFLDPALSALRRTHPEVKVKLFDLSPGEQIVALRKGTQPLWAAAGWLFFRPAAAGLARPVSIQIWALRSRLEK